MFRKGKKKSRQEDVKVDTTNNNFVAEEASTSDSQRIPDRADGNFDSNGFVDLSPPEDKRPTLLGPKQPCQYVGTFPVTTNDGGNNLESHKERTRFVKEKLKEYRKVEKGILVAMLMSAEGIKVVTPDEKRVRMAHALQRISFATCDPDNKIFAYMTNNPSPLGLSVHAHVFLTRMTKQAQDLTAMVGKAFKIAFANSKIAGGNTPKLQPVMDSDSPGNKSGQGRKWAKLEAQHGHDHSEHAVHARKKKAKPKKTANRSPPSQGADVMDRDESQGSRPQASPEDSALHGESIENAYPKQNGKMAALGNDFTQPEGQRLASESKVEGSDDDRRSPSPVDEAPPLPPRGRTLSSEQEETAEDGRATVAAEGPSGVQQHEKVVKRDSHEDECWYMPGIPREFIMEMLEKSEEGAFFVRDSQSRPGCYALTMRIPHEINANGFGNFLIIKSDDGSVMLQGFNRSFPNLTSLIEHYAAAEDGLPCKLLLAGSNLLCDDDDYVNGVSSDPDYENMYDFTSMLEELN